MPPRWLRRLFGRMLARCAPRTRRPHRPRFRPGLLALEGRLLPSGFTEVEGNNTAATANAVAVPSGSILTVSPLAALNVAGTIGSRSDVDFFRFTLGRRSGVFFDLDSRQTRLSATLDAALTLYDATGRAVLASNDDGYDFKGFTVPAVAAGSATSHDPSLYRDLGPGTYVVRVSSAGGTTGPYVLRLFADHHYGAAVPAFASNPGARHTLYLDFDGHTAADSRGTHTLRPYDFNGSPHELTPAEKLAVRNVWHVVAENFSPFAINVTTAYGGAIADGVAYRMVIANSNGSEVDAYGKLGTAFLDSYNRAGPTNNAGYTFALNFSTYGGGVSGEIMAKPVELANTATHEFGHALGLEHFLGGSPGPGALMYAPDTGLNREGWAAGYNEEGAYQDDLAVIAGGANGFGYRADDHGDAPASATTFWPPANIHGASGIIGRRGDRDFFRLIAAGPTTVRVEVDEYASKLDAELRLYDWLGNAVATADPVTSPEAVLTRNLWPGIYYLEVRGDGGPGEVGRYQLRVVTQVSPRATRVVATGSDAGGRPRVRVLDAVTRAERYNFLAFAPSFTGGVRVAAGDVTGDGVPDIIASTGRGTAAQVRVFDGASPGPVPAQVAGPLGSFSPYPGFSGGVWVAAGDVNLDGHADIITGADAGGTPHVQVFSGATGALLHSFLPYASAFRGGVRVAAGDLDGDGHADVLTAPGAGSAPLVLAYSGAGGVLIRGFFSFPFSSTGSIFVAAGDLTADGRADIVVGPGPGGSASLVRVFDSRTSGAVALPLRELAPYGGFRGGVRVALGDTDGDGDLDLLTAPGPGSQPRALAFDFLRAAAVHSFLAYETSFTGGVFIAAA